jgi:peptidoglycan/xylan/chitin deacetylase (PgdA/CDA1 family)
MYHRVTNLETDPWDLAVSPANFESQIACLKRKYRILSTEELTYQIQRGKIDSDSICLTFDDGYKDNYEIAKPILEKHNCPATFFIATSYLETQQPYWWDDLERIVLHSPKLPPRLEISINGEQLCFELENDGWLTEEQRQQQKLWTWQQEPPTKRCDAYFTIWERLKPLPYEQILDVLATLNSLVQKESSGEKDHFPMTFEQLADMSKNPLFTIGLHTHTHPALKFHSRGMQLSDINTNRQQLETLLDRSINVISYPYGIYNDDTLSIAEELQLKAAFTTNGKCIVSQSSPHKLGRIAALNHDGRTILHHIAPYFI